MASNAYPLDPPLPSGLGLPYAPGMSSGSCPTCTLHTQSSQRIWDQHVHRLSNITRKNAS